MIDKDEMSRLHALFNSCGPIFIALGDEVRQKLMLDIADASDIDENGINVTNLSAKSKLSRPAISHHLKVLKDCGLIAPAKVGTQIFYRLTLVDTLDKIGSLVASIQSVMSEIEAKKRAARQDS